MGLTSSRESADSPQESGGRCQLWLAGWLAGRPDVMARLLAMHRRLVHASAARRRRLIHGAGVTLAGAALLLALGTLRPASVGAGAITVDNGIVVVADDNKCSLVEAILNANSNNQVFTSAGECAVGSGADTINLGGGAFNLLTAYGGNAFYSDNGLPLITSDITVEGGGAIIERDAGAPKFRILAVAASGDLTLNNTTISGGDTTAWGGGIYVGIDGQATLTGSTIFGNRAYNGGGISTKLGTVTLTHSIVSGNSAGQFGGGLQSNLGTVMLATSTVSGNEAGNRGGGITVLHGNVMTAAGSTIRGNTAGNGGGAIYHIGGTVALTNTTISDNTSTSDNGGGILNRGGSTTLTNSTVTANSAVQGGGGGLHEEHQLAQVTLVRSLVSGNNSLVGDEIHRAADSGPITANSRNVFGHAGLTGADAFENFTPGATDFNATSSGENVPLVGIIGFLDNNGGPTFTHALVPGSPAIDFASSAACLTITDQRGFGRNVDGDAQSSTRECDSGAFEFDAMLATPSPIPSDTPIPSNTPTPSTTSSPTIGPSPTATATATDGPSPTPTHTATPGPSPTTTIMPTATLPTNLDWQAFVPVVVSDLPFSP